MSQADAMGSRGWIISYVLPPSVETEDSVYFAQRERVHNAIINSVLGGVFLPISFNADTNLMTLADTESDRIFPKSITVDEIACAFSIPERYRRKYAQERGSWAWLLRLKFNQNALLEIFEKNLIDAPIILDRDTDKNLEQVILKLVNAEYEHKVRQDPSSGSEVAYVLEASLNRK